MIRSLRRFRFGPPGAAWKKPLPCGLFLTDRRPEALFRNFDEMAGRPAELLGECARSNFP